jgi:uncharacterized protein (DUF1778 family)
MNDRTALLICCSEEEASTIRAQAKEQRRTLSDYVLHIVLRSVDMEERLSLRQIGPGVPNRSVQKSTVGLPGPRTALLVRCSTAEAKRIRAAAGKRWMPISRFVLHCLKRSHDISRRGAAGFFSQPPQFND